MSLSTATIVAASTLCTSVPASAITPPALAEQLAEPVSLSLMQDESLDDRIWKSRFVAGGGAAFGNSDNQSLHAGVDSIRETSDTITTLDGHYYYGASDGDRTQNKFTAGIRHDWLMPDSRWFYFAQGRYDYDEFQSWEHRIGAHAGVGYHWIDEDDFDVKLRAGAGVIKEIGSQDEDLRPEALLGADLEWQITERQSLRAGTTIYPDLGDAGEFRTVSYAGWAVVVDEEANMSLAVDLLHEYQSEVDPGVDKNDFRITAGIQFDF